MGAMTPATSAGNNCHDTLITVAGKGTAKRTIRVDADLWNRFATRAAKAGTDRTTALRDFIRWYVGEPAAELPRREPATTPPESDNVSTS